MAAKPALIPHAEADSVSTALRADNFYWRFIATALGFLLFGLSALVLSCIILPLFRCLPAARCQRMSRNLLQRGMRRFAGFLQLTGALTYEVRGAERLGRPGQLIVANHPSLIDVVFLIAFTPQANCVVKHAMFRNLLTRTVVRAAGYISNELPADVIEGSAAALRSGQCVIMFPEGTRSRPGQPLVFQRGAANVAVRAARVATPVYIHCDPATLTKSEPWYRIPPRRPHFAIAVGEDFDLSDFRAAASVPLASRACNTQWCAHFNGELQRADGYTAQRSQSGR